MTRWSLSDDFHLRRLAYEGLRPRLSWASKLRTFIDDPTPALPILENLKQDPVRILPFQKPGTLPLNSHL